MRLVHNPFHTAPSTKYMRPSMTSTQLVLKRITDFIVDRGDTYKREAFSELANAREQLSEELYLKFRFDHDM